MNRRWLRCSAPRLVVRRSSLPKHPLAGRGRAAYGLRVPSPKPKPKQPAPAVATGYQLLDLVSLIDDSREPFALWVPKGYTPRKSWPLLVVLHGSDADHRMIPEECFRMQDAGFDERMIVLSPFGRGDVDWRWMGEADLWQAIRHVREKHRIDGRRIYLAGLSMGAFATWRLAAEFPDQFAAIVPICGGGEIGTMPLLRKKPIWCIHGAQDEVVPVSRSRTLVEELRRLGSKVRYDELPATGHDSWKWLLHPDRTADLVDWLLSHKLAKPALAITGPLRHDSFGDLFSERVVITYPATSAISQESDQLRSEAEKLARFHFGDWAMRSGKLNVKPDSEMTEADLRAANVLVIGRSDNCSLLRGVEKRLQARHATGRLVFRGETLLGKSWAAATVQPSPWNKARLLGLITYQQRGQIVGLAEKFVSQLDRLGSGYLLDTRSGVLTAFSGKAGAA